MDIFEEAWKTYGDVAARVLSEQETKLRRITRKWCSPSQFDDMFSDVIIWRLPRVIETWDPDKGSLEGHVFRTMRWYCFKWIKRHNKQRLPEFIDHSVTLSDDIEVSDLLSILPEADAHLLRQFAIEGYTRRELALAYGCSRPAISRRISEALARARSLITDG